MLANTVGGKTQKFCGAKLIFGPEQFRTRLPQRGMLMREMVSPPPREMSFEPYFAH